MTNTICGGELPLFSVIITNYNYARYLGQCIRSVLSQDYPNFEVIVVDDGSQDDSLTTIESFGPALKVVRKINGGMLSSWNSGWMQARGDMILILDADDFLVPGALAVHARALSDKAVVHSQGYQMIVDENGQPNGRKYPDRRPQDSGLLEIVLRFGPGGYIATATSGNAWSRTFFEQVFPLPESRTVGGDALLFDIAPMYGRTVTTETVVASYRFHGASMGDEKAVFSARNISAIVDGHEFRARRVRTIAESLGYKVDARWRARNWRFATLLYLRSKLLDSSDGPRLIDHLAAAFGCRNPIKAIAVFLAVLAIRLSPTAISMSIASRIIRLQEM